jgi:uroporphyrinogen decarboxylase
MHSCGKIDPLIPQLIDWGLDALEFDSPRLCGYPDLERFRGKIMFWACINIQTIYPNGTPDDCEREVWHMVRNLGTPEGGFGAYYYPRIRHIQAPRSNVEAFTRGLSEYGVYSKIPGHWWDSPVPTSWPDDEVPPVPE